MLRDKEAAFGQVVFVTRGGASFSSDEMTLIVSQVALGQDYKER